MLKKEVSNLSSIMCVFACNKVSHLRETIHNDKDRILTSPRSGEAGDEVHGNVFPRSVRRRQWSVVAVRMSGGLGSLTRATRLAKASDMLRHVRPEEMLSEGSER